MSRYSNLSIFAIVLSTVCTVTYAAQSMEKDVPVTSQAKIPSEQVTSANQQVHAKAFTGEKLAKNAKISMNEARAIALKAHPGKITDEELETEKGGSGLRYSFDIKGAKGTQEVGVDAKTGKVLENKLEGPNPD